MLRGAPVSVCAPRIRRHAAPESRSARPQPLCTGECHMLVLSRRLNERIVLPGIQTTFEVLGIRAGTVRIGVEAPQAVSVLRDEVWQRERDRKDVPDLLRAGAAWS